MFTRHFIIEELEETILNVRITNSMSLRSCWKKGWYATYMVRLKGLWSTPRPKAPLSPAENPRRELRRAWFPSPDPSDWASSFNSAPSSVSALFSSFPFNCRRSRDSKQFLYEKERTLCNKCAFNHEKHVNVQDKHWRVTSELVHFWALKASEMRKESLTWKVSGLGRRSVHVVPWVFVITRSSIPHLDEVTQPFDVIVEMPWITVRQWWLVQSSKSSLPLVCETISKACSVRGFYQAVGCDIFATKQWISINDEPWKAVSHSIGVTSKTAATSAQAWADRIGDL